MADFPFSDLLQKVELDAWKKGILLTAESLGLDVENWAEGGFFRIFLALFSQLYVSLGQAIQIIAMSRVLDKADGFWLKLLAKQVYNVDPIEATFAKAANALVLTNSGGGQYPIAPGEVTVARVDDTSKTYHNTTGGTLLPGGTLTLDLIADEPGSDSSAGVGRITVLVTTYLGVACTNVVALFGLDEEKPNDLRQRCRDSVAARAIGGVKRAYQFYAKSARRADGTAIGITRVRVMPPPGDGSLTVYVAGASGAVTSDDVAVVQASFDENVTPYGFDAAAISASNISVAVPCTIWLPASQGVSEADAQQDVFNALKEYIESVEIGGTIISPATGKIYWRALLGVVSNAVPGAIKAQLTSEVDIDVAVGLVPVWTGLLAQTTVVQVT